MPDIYNYMDYREYLHDFYAERKRVHSSFSFQVFANKAGFKSKSFISHLIDGTKNLSEESTHSLSQALGLDEKRQEYFEVLVAFNQAESHAQKTALFAKLMEFNSWAKAKVILRDQYDFYSAWYHNTIRELAPIVDFKDNFALLGRLVKPRITARQARNSINLLLKLGLLERKGDRYIQTASSITTGDVVQSLAVEHFHLQNFNLAGESIDTCPGQDRDISCIVAALSSERFAKVQSEIRTFRKKLMAIMEGDKEPDRVYHISMQIFPTSEPIIKDNH